MQKPTAFVCLSFIILLSGAVQASQQPILVPVTDRALTVEIEPLYEIGSDSGPSEQLLFGLVDVAFAADGELYVLEERGYRVQVFDADGRQRTTFGRQGQGPGEFQLPMSIAVSGDEVVVWDFLLGAYLVYDRDGVYLRNVAPSSRRAQPSRDSLRTWPGGGVVYLPTELHDEGRPLDDIDRGAIVHQPLGRDEAASELVVVRHPRRRSQMVGRIRMLNTGPSFSPTARWDVFSDGTLAVADGPGYRVRFIAPDGTERPLSRAIEPRAVTDDDRERERERIRRVYEGPVGGVSFGGGGAPRRSGFSPSEVDAIGAAIEFADVVPVILDLRVDPQDRLWIQRHAANYGDDGPIDIVTAAGEYLGTLPPMPMPDAFGPGGLVAWMDGGRDVEVERVTVARLPAPLR